MAWGAIATVTLAMLGTVAPQYFVEKDTSSVTVNLSSIYDFSFDLYRQLSPKGRAENILFSPYSIWAALAMAYFGSEGDTKIQLKAALRVTDKISTLKLWRKLGMKYSENATTVTQHSLSVVNRAYFDESLTLRPYMSKILHSELKLIDFSDLQESAATINAFVSNTTNGKIPTLLSPDDLVYAVMLLINAAYFKGTWKYQFDSSSTASKQFFVSPGNPVDVLMMKTKTKLRLGKLCDGKTYNVEDSVRFHQGDRCLR
nr:serpin B6-like [Procambarus clarkii]